ncbi:MalM family protein [Vibrio breoganii]
MKWTFSRASIPLISLMSVIAVAGCESLPDIEQTSSSTATSFEQLKYETLELPADKKVIISDSTQSLMKGDINSPVAAFWLPTDRGGLRISVVSQIEKSVFAPTAIILGESNEVLKKVSLSEFEYLKPRLHLGNRLVAEFDFYPPVNQKQVALIVYSSTEDQSGVTPVIHPVRLEAEARGNYMPELKDIPIPNALEGRLEIGLEGVSQSEKFTLTSEPQKQAETLKSQEEYIAEIEKAVAEGDLDTALQLRDQAKANNIEGADEAFKKALSAEQN